MIKKIRSWNTQVCVVKTSLEPMPQNLTKKKSGVKFRQLYLPMPSLPHRFFGGIDRPHGCLKLHHSLSVWHSEHF